MACSKTKYSTSIEAMLALARIEAVNKHKRKQRFNEEPSRVYQCEWCHSWHLTSQSKKDAEPVD
jgi:hypothetical protein